MARYIQMTLFISFNFVLMSCSSSDEKTTDGAVDKAVRLTATDLEGTWIGTLKFTSEKESGESPVTMTVTTDGTNVTGKVWGDGEADNAWEFKGTINNNVWSYAHGVSPKDAAHEDCSGDGWKVSGTATLNKTKDLMTLSASGIFCSASGSYTGSLTKQ